MMELYREWPSDSNYREEGSNDIGSHAGMSVLAIHQEAVAAQIRSPELMTSHFYPISVFIYAWCYMGQ